MNIDLFHYSRIVCFGDSITHGGYYHMFLQEYLAEKDPGHPRFVVNNGISGNQVADLLKRAPGMLQSEKPDLVFVMIGTNDLLFNVEFQESELPLENAMKKYPVFSRYERELGELITLLKNGGRTDVILLAVPPYNESRQTEITVPCKNNMDSSGMKNLVLIQEQIAKKYGIPFVDIAAPLRANLRNHADLFPRGKNDRVHPSRAEHKIIAETILGKVLSAGSKAEIAERNRNAQYQLQDIRLMLDRIPKDCVTLESKMDWHRKWVASLGPSDREYHEKTIPILAEYEKNVVNLTREIAETFAELYA